MFLFAHISTWQHGTHLPEGSFGSELPSVCWTWKSWAGSGPGHHGMMWRLVFCPANAFERPHLCQGAALLVVGMVTSRSGDMRVPAWRKL